MKPNFSRVALFHTNPKVCLKYFGEDCSLITLLMYVKCIDVKIDGSVLEEKSFSKMLGLTFSSKLDWGSYIISTAKTVSKKIGALIRSMKFLSPDVALFLYKSIIRLCMVYCCTLL